MKKITINRKEILDEDITGLSKYQEGWCDPSYISWNQPAGHTEYKLYSYLSKKVNSPIILDIGTLFGGSALALSANDKSKVISYDLVELSTHEHLIKNNIEFRVGNFMEDDYDYSKISLIVIDVEPHDGTLEPPMIEHVVSQGFKGLILLDDISSMFPGMPEMWDSLPYEKYNVTEIGHFSGTGILNIGQKYELDFVFGE